MLLHNIQEIQEARGEVRHAAQNTRHALINDLNIDPMEALYNMRFERFGYHPLHHNDRENLSEQLHQSFHIMVSLAAAQHLLEMFPQCDGLHVNPANTPGRDIYVPSANPDEPIFVEAEVFAAVHQNNNDKLVDDILSLVNSPAQNRFVFFHSPGCDFGRQRNLELEEAHGIQVWSLDRQRVI